MRGRLILLFVLLAICGALRGDAVLDCVDIKTKAPGKPVVRVWYRLPCRYALDVQKTYRMLVIFGGRNCDGRDEISGKFGWTEWADVNDIVLVAPAFKDDEYWVPKSWSGKALDKALDVISSRHRISRSKILYYGYSAGGQASNLFPAWKPEMCRAYVSHACGMFHSPNPKMRAVGGLVTCGDADAVRYILSRCFVNRYAEIGISVLWKSFPNCDHDIPPGSVALAMEFLAYHHWTNLEDLGMKSTARSHGRFVGDDADNVYYFSDSEAVSDILESDMVELPSVLVARAWGGGPDAPAANGALITNIVNGIKMVARIPSRVYDGARILVLIGDEGWNVAKTIDEFGFGDWADRIGWFIIVPSVSDGSDGCAPMANAVATMVDCVRGEYGFRQYPVFIFGYSAGGQLAAGIQELKPQMLAAWGVYGCSVYPKRPSGRLPAFVACGIDDAECLRISRDFVYDYREAGGDMLWKYADSGHALNQNVLHLVREFFVAVAGGVEPVCWGEDDTMQIMEKDDISLEFRNPIYNDAMRRLWQSR